MTTGFSPGEFVKKAVEELREALPEGRAVVAGYGGVDSTVCAVLAHRAFGERAHPVFQGHRVHAGRWAKAVPNALNSLGIPVEIVPAASRFFQALAGLTDPEGKRKSFRSAFHSVFAEVLEQKGARALVQGTPAVDGVETQAAVKTHHNVLDLVLESWLKDLLVLEPLRIKIL